MRCNQPIWSFGTLSLHICVELINQCISCINSQTPNESTDPFQEQLNGCNGNFGPGTFAPTQAGTQATSKPSGSAHSGSERIAVGMGLLGGVLAVGGLLI